jgi:transposase InsO family protein
MMPWEKVTEMSLKLEFVTFALQEAEPFMSLCRRFKISPKTGYKYLNRYKEFGEQGLAEISRRPLTNPNQTACEIENKILEIREWKPAWGARKIRSYLLNKNETKLPATSTITDILNRHGLIEKKDLPAKAFKRFEHPSPNDLWQIDFKGHFQMHKGRCHPLTVLDDHSRFSLGLRACSNQSKDVVQAHFKEIFQEYGLPYRINFDNGTPWASVNSHATRFTELSLWLIRLGIQVSYSRIRRPQTNGKIERFHQTLKKELLQYKSFYNIKDAQKHFDSWRMEYNLDRPHEAINLKAPVTRYKLSERKYFNELPSIEYRCTDIIRNVSRSGSISFKSKKIFVGEGFRNMPVAIREDSKGGYQIYFCNQKIVALNMDTD